MRFMENPWVRGAGSVVGVLGLVGTLNACKPAEANLAELNNLLLNVPQCEKGVSIQDGKLECLNNPLQKLLLERADSDAFLS
jgi:hypothetical protein